MSADGPDGTDGDEAAPRRAAVLPVGAGTGWWAVQASWVGVVLQGLAAAAAVGTHWARGPHVIVCTLLILGGVAGMAVAFLRAVARSRTELIDVPALFLLLGSVPRRTRAWLWAAVAASTAVGLAGAAARPYTSLAFGVMVPLWPYGFAVLWNALHGAFPLRPSRA